MANFRSDRDTKLSIDVNSISIASKKHRLKLLPGQSLGQDFSLGWQEQMTMHFYIVPKIDNSALSECQLANRSQPWSKGSRPSDFICLEHAHEKFMVR